MVFLLFVEREEKHHSSVHRKMYLHN